MRAGEALFSSRIREQMAEGFTYCCETCPLGTLAEILALVEAADRVVNVHKRLIHAVTPGHPGWIDARGPHSTPEGNEEYDALFSEWHAASRQLRDALDQSGEYA